LPVPAEFGRLRVVLVASRNPLNIGAAARAMSNFGFLNLRVVNPYEIAFREARSAVGAAALLTDAEECKSVAEAVADCGLVVGTTAGHRRELRQPLQRLEHGASLIRKQLVSGRVALLFGSERVGLSNQDLSHCHWLMRIPTRAVCLYELVCAHNSVGTAEKEVPATARDLERFTGVLLEVLRASGYIHPGTATSAEEKVRRLVRRLNLEARDAEVWLGMLRQIAWKVRAEEKKEG